MARAPGVPVLRGEWLETGSAGESAVAVDTPQWRAWLGSATAFRVEHPAGGFTVRRERSGGRRGGGYWRAYRRVAGQRRRVYLGSASQVTAATLAAAAAALADGLVDGVSPPPPAAGTTVPPVREPVLPRPELQARLEQGSGCH